MSEIVLYNRHIAHLRAAVERIDTVDEAKDLADKAAAAQTWARRVNLGKEVVNHAAEVKLRAERRAGELLKDNPDYGRGKKSLTNRDLGIDHNQSSQWQDLADLSDSAFDNAIAQAKDEGLVSTRGVLRKAKRGVTDPPPPQDVTPPVGRYRCIIIDPPWPVEKIVRDVRPQTRALDYPTMGLDEIAALPIPELAIEDGCHVYLWVTHKFLPSGLDLFKTWGVKYECPLTWVKPTGMTPYSWNYNTEHVLFGRVGSLKLTRMGLKLGFDAPTAGHSVKPDEFYDRVREASPAPRLELFARRERDGFKVWGNEVAA